MLMLCQRCSEPVLLHLVLMHTAMCCMLRFGHRLLKVDALHLPCSMTRLLIQ
jgi:hypothetical protein